MSFYDKVNKKSKGAKKEFEIIFVSRCRDFESFGQYVLPAAQNALRAAHSGATRSQHVIWSDPLANEPCSPPNNPLLHSLRS